MKPSDFTNYPFRSVFEKSEYETVAQNIMVILSRTGDKFRNLSWKEYAKERGRDHNFSNIEMVYFKKVKPYCASSSKAKLFSKEWNKPKTN